MAVTHADYATVLQQLVDPLLRRDIDAFSLRLEYDGGLFLVVRKVPAVGLVGDALEAKLIECGYLPRALLDVILLFVEAERALCLVAHLVLGLLVGHLYSHRIDRAIIACSRGKGACDIGVG